MAHAPSNKPVWFLALAILVAGCGGGQSEANDPNSIEALLATPASSTKPASDAPPVSDEGGGTGSKEVEAAGGSQLNDQQKAQMETALRRGVSKVEHCYEVVDNCPTGTSEVEIVFDGKQGKITDVHVTQPPFAGTPAEACIKRAFIKEFVLPFDGDPIVVPYKITIAKSKGGAAAPKSSK